MRKGEINNPLSPHLELEEDDQESLSSVSKETENEDTFNTSRYTAPIKIGNAAPPDAPPSGYAPHNNETINFFQKTYGNLATLRYYNYPNPVQTKHKIDQPGDIYEREADRAAERITRGGSAESVDLSGIGPGIQLAPAETSTPSTPATTSAAETAQTSSTTVASATTATPGLIVDDSVKEPATGQMKKEAFLRQLRKAVNLTVESALVGTDRTAADCPWIGYWFGFYESRSSRQIERDILRYAPEASGVTSAKDYIPIFCARVRRGVDNWKTTGKITGVPEGISTGLPDTDGGLLSGIAGAVGNLLFKARDGGVREGADPRAIRSRLGSGSPLDSGVRSKVESVFGQDLSAVRVHTDSGAARLSDGLNARAFTIGSDIAFGTGEYKPGTLIGDALIAHELAHVVQQGGGNAPSAPMQKGETGHGPLEEEADMSAVGAVASIWGGIKGGVANIAKNAVPRLRSGLRLQRCIAGCSKSKDKPKLKPVCPSTDGLHFFPAEKLLVFIQANKVSARFDAVGGPPMSRTEGTGALPANPTKKGSFIIHGEEKYRTPTWLLSNLKWGVELKDMKKKNDVYYKLPSGKWGSIKNDYGITRENIKTLYRKLYPDPSKSPYGTGDIPSQWIFNDFGPIAIRYFRDINKNRKLDPKKESLEADMLHTTPKSEASHQLGKPVELSESHGCIHIKPEDRVKMKGLGAFKPGTPIIIHGYDEGFQCPK